MTNKGKWFQIILGSFVVIWLLRFPPTRMIILWLLPLGSGWDDAIQIVLIVVVLLLWSTKNVFFGKSLRKRFDIFKNIFKDENEENF